MKKIIWVFGECGSGRKTLINNILTNTNNIREELGLENQNITVARETIEKYDKRIMDLIEKGYKVTQIDTTEGYIIENKNNSKVR